MLRWREAAMAARGGERCEVVVRGRGEANTIMVKRSETGEKERVSDA